MKHDYRIIGMTCNGCRTTVEKALNSIDGIKQATVILPDHAAIEMDNHIRLLCTFVRKYTLSLFFHTFTFSRFRM
jgi:copper chaperone CopZ